MAHGLRLYFDPKTIKAFYAHPLEMNNPAALDCTGMDDSTFEGLFVCWP